MITCAKVQISVESLVKPKQS